MLSPIRLVGLIAAAGLATDAPDEGSGPIRSRPGLVQRMSGSRVRCSPTLGAVVVELAPTEGQYLRPPPKWKFPWRELPCAVGRNYTPRGTIEGEGPPFVSLSWTMSRTSSPELDGFIVSGVGDPVCI